MPYRPRSRGSDNATVIEVSIPVRMMRGNGAAAADAGDDDDETTCYICANAFCAAEACGRAMTHLGCCTQAICCSCLVKTAKRCTCKEDCDAVISLCPYCREVSGLDALDVFLGYKPPCAQCRVHDDPAPVPAPDPDPDPDSADERVNT